jgi:type I restriction enzyme S subunit
MTYKEVTVRMNGKGVVERRQVQGLEIASDRRYQASAGQFIISRIDARNGASGLVPNELNGAVVTNDFPLFDVAQDRLDSAFLNWMSKTASFVDLCKRASEGTTNRVRLSEDRFKALEIALPPLAEQRRIVAQIEELASKIEEARKTRKIAIEELAALRQVNITAYMKSLNADARLNDVLTVAPRNGWSPNCDNLESGTSVLTLSAVTGWNYNPSAFKRTSQPTDLNANYWAVEGDLLITRSNTPELVGHAAIYNGSPNPCIYPDLMMKVPVDRHKVSTRFVWYWLQSVRARDFIRRSAKGTSPTMKKISQSVVQQVPFPANLTLDEQEDIVRRIDALQASTNAVAGIQAETSDALDAILPAILDRAFKGELT